MRKPEELYECSRESRPWLPDLLLIPHESLAVIRKIRGKRVVRWLPYRRLEGTHRPDGVFVASGPGITQTSPVENRCHSLRAHIVDCAPTILAMLGLPVPDNMEGRVITEIFETPPVVERSAPQPLGNGSGVAQEPPALAPSVSSRRLKPAAQCESQTEQAYTPEELQQVTERLSDLGYLE